MTDERNDSATERTPPRPAAPGGRRGRATRPRHPDRPCMNCGDPTPGEYCPTCGQRKVEVQVSVRTLAMDVLEDHFILDQRLPRTLGALLARPGFLTVEFVNGRIVRYIHPFRLYLVSSLVFFVLLSFFSLQFVRQALETSSGSDAVAATTGDAAAEALEEIRLQLADTTITGDARQELLAAETALMERRDSLPVAPADTAAETAGDTAGDTAATDTPGVIDTTTSGDGTLIATDDRPLREVFGWDEDPPTVEFPNARIEAVLESQLRRIGAMTPREAGETLLGTFFNYVPTLMFILLPVFGVVLKLLYIRRRRFYAEHFVFLLHVHSVVYILATLMLVLRGILPAVVEVLLGGWILVYIYLAMKRVYGQGWLKTFLKYWTLGWAYFWILALTAPLALIATLLLF